MPWASTGDFSSSSETTTASEPRLESCARQSPAPGPAVEAVGGGPRAESPTLMEVDASVADVPHGVQATDEEAELAARIHQFISDSG